MTQRDTEWAPEATFKAKTPSAPTAKPEAKRTDTLSFTERKRLESLPDLISKMEAEISKLGELLEAEDLFTKEPVKFRKASEMMAERQAQLAGLEEEWMTLEEKATL
jgi:ATP-binding cassette subfamily F protein uup